MNNIIKQTVDIIVNCYRNGGKVLVCGNGGSAADSGHIVGELMKGFILKRPTAISEHLQTPLRAIDLTAQSTLISAIANDLGADFVYAQQVFGYADKGDVFIGISTSGNSKNVLFASEIAKKIGVFTIGMTGSDGGKMNELFDLLIKSRETVTHKIQEEHIKIYHYICIKIEEKLFNE
ncbi:phosphoheptose isomerase 2 [Clostridia bacterium]|nr:phosphoheptose isomerase 2 [Clostridia bacterium]